MGRVLSIFWVPLLAFFVRVVMGYRVRDVHGVRRRFRAMTREVEPPVLICANHLTLIDSILISWALGGSWWYVVHYRWLPWNLPETKNFAFNWINRLAVWIVKCIPVERGGRREEVSRVLRRVQYLLERGETAMIFAESGRSRTGRVDLDSLSHGMGRLVSAVDDCQVLCVYLRGDRQDTWSNVPARGDVLDVDFELMEPRARGSGIRQSRRISRQIGERLVAMEERYFDRRE